MNEDSHDPSRYGLHKVYRREYDCNPDRYILRIDYPNFPGCSFGGSLSMLGFDTARQTWGWLVTSILWDSWLGRARYDGLDVTPPTNERSR